MMDASKIRKRATAWLVRVQTAKDLESLWPEFEAWLNQNPEHRRAYELEERKWADCDSLKAWTVQDTSRAPEVVMQKVAKARRRMRAGLAVRVGAVAICVVVAITIFIGSGRGRVEARPGILYTADTGELTPVVLKDGSIVQLGAHAQIRAKYTQTERDIALDQGEAYFDVSQMPERPFNVEAGSYVVEATGTAFSVKKEGNGQIETAVKRGSVEVKPANRVQIVAILTGPKPRTVGVGQVATIDPSGKVTVDEVTPAELAHRLAWTNPMIDLNGTLEEAVARFNLYNVRKLIIGEPELAQIRISGRYRATEPEKFAESLKHLGITHVMVGSEASSEAKILLSSNGDQQPHARP
jgi:transmembrane sensor